MENKKQTATTFFLSKLVDLNTHPNDTRRIIEWYQQAKLIERQQMIDFSLKLLEVDCSNTGTDILIDEAEQLYNLTYSTTTNEENN